MLMGSPKGLINHAHDVQNSTHEQSNGRIQLTSVIRDSLSSSLSPSLAPSGLWPHERAKETGAVDGVERAKGNTRCITLRVEEQPRFAPRGADKVVLFTCKCFFADNISSLTAQQVW